MSPSVREICALNIKFYREKLRTETDEPRRRTIAQLLAEEEAKLIKAARSVSSGTSLHARPNPANGKD